MHSRFYGSVARPVTGAWWEDKFEPVGFKAAARLEGHRLLRAPPSRLSSHAGRQPYSRRLCPLAADSARLTGQGWRGFIPAGRADPDRCYEQDHQSGITVSIAAAGPAAANFSMASGASPPQGGRCCSELFMSGDPYMRGRITRVNRRFRPFNGKALDGARWAGVESKGTGSAREWVGSNFGWRVFHLSAQELRR